MHKIATRTSMSPHDDMVSWIISQSHVQACSIVDHNKNCIASWRPEVLRYIYNINSPKILLDKDFLNNFNNNVFNKKNRDNTVFIKKWLHGPKWAKI